MKYHIPFEVVVDAFSRLEAEQTATEEMQKLGIAVSLYAHNFNTQANIAILPSAQTSMNEADKGQNRPTA